MSKKDILFMCQFFYPEYITSARLPYQTATALSKEGYTVDVLTGYPSEYMKEKNIKVPRKESKNGINIFRIKYLQVSRANKISRIINYFSIVFFMLLRVFKIRKYKSVVVYSNPPILPLIAILANIFFGTKIIFISYDVYPEIAINTDIVSENGLISTVMTQINNQLFKRATKVVALSKEMKELLINKRDIDSKDIVVIPNWDTDASSKATSFETKKIQDKYIVSYLGNMGIPQDFITILKAIKDPRIQESNIEFYFVGHGNKKDKIKKYIKNNNLNNVKVYNFLQGEEYKNLKKNTDAYILSLKSELIGQAVPSKFYTYISENKPIIGIIDDKTDIAKEIKKYKLGYQVNNKNVEEFVSYLLKLSEGNINYDNKQIYNTYYQKEIQLKKYIELFKTIL